MVMSAKLEAAERDRLIDFVGDAIATDRGDSYAEYRSEYRQYATAAVDAMQSPELQYRISTGGKVHALRAELLDALKSMMAASEEPDPDSKSPRDLLLATAWQKARAVIAKEKNNG